MYKRVVPILIVLSMLGISVAAQSLVSGAPDETFFKPVKWRSIGPFRGGRSVSSTGVKGDPLTYYMGTTGGGVWKSEDMGLTWRNISDGYFTTGSVGAIAVSESDTNVVYVGMGEHAVRGVMTHHGDGVYKSTDAGRTWKKMGLEASQHISRIIIDPKDPDTVFVAVQGALYSPSEERGVYKSVDGGVTWKKVLYVNPQIGAADLSIDSKNSRIMYAAMWEHGRLPWKVISGPGSGLFKSVDSGETWKELKQGLPEKKGKLSIAASPSNPDKVYALIEGDSNKEEGGLFVSTNGGERFTRVTNDHRLVQRAWYYIELFIDPKDENTVYVLSAPALRSEDGGRTWSSIRGTHGDFHDLWINPDNPKNMVISNDGGAAITFNRGATWSSQDNMPTAQFYRINVDNQFPYRIYGGQQDNTSVAIQSRQFASGGITTEGWTWSAGGESAFLAFDPDNPEVVLGGSYQGTIEALNMRKKAGTNIMAAPIQYLGMDAKDIRYRYNWNAPIVWSRWEPNTYFHGAQVLLKTTDTGRTWKEISPDLTRNEKSKQGKGGGPLTNEAVGAENYGTLAYVAESKHERGVIWTGSDDGLVHVTRDGGKTWTNVTPKGLEECLVNAIEISPHDKATVYIATTRYKFNDHRPGLYKTTDYGKTWRKINDGIPANAFTRVVREDEVRRGMLFAGTELGLFISVDDGTSWQRFQLNLPITPITDLRVHQGNLIASTSGRGFWILDDLSLLRQTTSSAQGFRVFKPADSYLANGSSELNYAGASFGGSNILRGVNPANGVVIYYNLPESPKDKKVTIRINDASGALVREFSTDRNEGFEEWDGGPPEDSTPTATSGLNKFVWDMRYPLMNGVPGVYIEAGYNGHKAIPGKYSVTVTADGRSETSDFMILENPTYGVSAESYAEYHAFMMPMENNVREMHDMVNDLYAKQMRLKAFLDGLGDDAKSAELKKDGTSILTQLKAWDSAMVQRLSKAYDDVENFPNGFTADYLFLINQTESDIPQVNSGSKEIRNNLDAKWAALKARGVSLRDRMIPDFNRKLGAAGFGPVW
ncbi:MAG: hypothetical protein R2684_01245 [Pyrinomonadaceae bacterium]